MKNEDNSWNPGHRVTKGYPFEKVESKDLFPSRVKTAYHEDSKKISIDINPEIFPDLPEVGEQRTGFEDFLMFRLHEAMNALEIAEGQIQDMLDEDPFIPEYLGFEIVHENEQPTEAPIKIYNSKYSEGVSIFRKPSDVHDPNWDPAIWTMLQKNPNGEAQAFKETTLHLPCQRIAYAAFYALGIKMREESFTEKIEEAEETK
jgi:hypothetical protein